MFFGGEHGGVCTVCNRDVFEVSHGAGLWWSVIEGLNRSTTESPEVWI